MQFPDPGPHSISLTRAPPRSTAPSVSPPTKAATRKPTKQSVSTRSSVDLSRRAERFFLESLQMEPEQDLWIFSCPLPLPLEASQDRSYPNHPYFWSLRPA